MSKFGVFPVPIFLHSQSMRTVIHGFTISVPVLILPVFREKFRVNVCFETSEHSMQAADDNSKVISQAFQLTLVLNNFKLALYFNSVIINNQIKYYLTRNRGNFMQIQYGFTDMLCHFQQ